MLYKRKTWYFNSNNLGWLISITEGSVRFQVLKAVSAKMAVFWVVAACCLGEVTNVSGVSASSIIALLTVAARTSETLVNFFKTTRHYNPEDSHLRKAL
jgi:hypothetical protein